ncbi:hypothetical protein D3C79_955080 [compost metagenome]
MTLDLCANIHEPVGANEAPKARMVTSESLERRILLYSGTDRPVAISMITKIDALNLPRMAAVMVIPSTAAEPT